MSDDDWRKRAAQWSSERSVALLAIDDQEPCGIAAGFFDSDDAGSAHLVSVWVAPAYRRRGVGQRLVTAIAEWAQPHRAHSLRLMVTSNNEAAIRFYERLGFAKTGRTAPYPNDASLVEYEMCRRFE